MEELAFACKNPKMKELNPRESRETISQQSAKKRSLNRMTGHKITIKQFFCGHLGYLPSLLEFSLQVSKGLVCKYLNQCS